MFDRIAISWKLVKMSLSVLAANPKLLLFPAATGTLTIVIGLLFAAPIAFQPTQHSYASAEHWKSVGNSLIVTTEPTARDRAKGRDRSMRLSGQGMSYFVLFYLLSLFLATFFNVAFVHEVFDALDGNNVSVAEGLTFALSKLMPILLWTLCAGVVGLVIKALEKKLEKWLVRSIGLAWSVAVIFVVPVLVVEEVPTPLDALKRSAALIRKTWGEALVGYAGLQLGAIGMAISGVWLIGMAVFIRQFTDAAFPFVVMFLTWLIAAVAFSYAMGVAEVIYLCALYRFATTGQLVGGLTPETVKAGWRLK
jgi:hypothetical protein